MRAIDQGRHAQLLEGEAWQAVRDDVLTTLGLPGSPDALLTGHSRTLDSAYREAGGRLAASTGVTIDGDGKIHLTGVKVIGVGAVRALAPSRG